MLTPQEISGKEFVKAVFGGYDMSAVDDFLETLTADYATLFKENAILKSKIKVLVEKVEEYRSTEDAMRMALLTAQKLGDEITSEAKKKSDDMLAHTDADIRARLAEMKSKFADEDERLKSLRDETRRFIQGSQEIIRQHSAFLARLDELNQNVAEPLSVSDDAPRDTMPPVTAPAAPAPAAVEDDDDDVTVATAAPVDDTPEVEIDPEADPFKSLYDAEATKVIRMNRETSPDEDDAPTSPRPKFDFDDLKFGANYSGD